MVMTFSFDVVADGSSGETIVTAVSDAEDDSPEEWDPQEENMHTHMAAHITVYTNILKCIFVFK